MAVRRALYYDHTGGQVNETQTGDTVYGAGGGGNTVQVLVDFGFASANEGDLARTTITGQSWVTTSSVIVLSGAAISTPDHDPDDITVEGIVAYAENLVAGVGFDVVALAPQNSWGRYYINAMGI